VGGFHIRQSIKFNRGAAMTLKANNSRLPPEINGFSGNEAAFSRKTAT